MGLRPQTGRKSGRDGEHNAVVVLEGLSHLRGSTKRGTTFNEKLSLWFYRRARLALAREALERGLDVRRVNPKRTSSTCPRCGGKLGDNGDRVLYCSEFGFVGGRDAVACVNLFLGSRYVEV